MSTPVEIDRTCPKALLQPLRSRWYRFPSQSYNYFSYPSVILQFLGERSIGRGWHKKIAPQNIGIATEIVSISVSVPELIPVWDYVSTSGLYLMLFSEVGRRQCRWKWIGHARKLCRSCLHHVYISSLLFPAPTYNYFRFASAILNLQVHEVYDMAYDGKKCERKSLESRF